MTTKIPTVYRDIHDIEIREGDIVVTTYEGERPQTVPAGAHEGTVVGFGSRRVYVRFQGEQFYRGPSGFHRIYPEYLDVVRSQTGVPVDTHTKRVRAVLYCDLAGAWTLEVITGAIETNQWWQLTEPGNSAMSWAAVTGLAERDLRERAWNLDGAWEQDEHNPLEGQVRVINNPETPPTWEIPSEALDIAIDLGDAETGIFLAVKNAFGWLADRLEVQRRDPDTVAEIRAVIRALKPSTEE